MQAFLFLSGVVYQLSDRMMLSHLPSRTEQTLHQLKLVSLKHNERGLKRANVTSVFHHVGSF